MGKSQPDGNKGSKHINPITNWRQQWLPWNELIADSAQWGYARPSLFQEAASVTTNKEDYAPGELVTITASGFTPGATVRFSLADDPADPGADGDVDDYGSFSVTDGSPQDLDGEVNGTVVTTWTVPSDDDGSGQGPADALDATLLLVVEGSDGLVASATFTDSLPADAPVDLTAYGSFGEIQGALFSNAAYGAGTGVIDPFVRIQRNGSEQGYNSSAKQNQQFDETGKYDSQYNKALALASVPIAYLINPQTQKIEAYRELRLDINENSNAQGQQYLSLDALQIYQSTSSILYGFTGSPTATGTFSQGGISDLCYNLDAGGDAWVALNYDLQPGSGVGDVSVFIPDSVFDTNQAYLYVYSAFGFEPNEEGGKGKPGYLWESSDGFEEWSVGVGGPVAASDLKGFKFYDGDRDGVYSTDLGSPDKLWTAANGFGEPVTFYLDPNNNGSLDPDELWTTTNPLDGTYTFTDLAAGLGDGSKYLVRELVPAGYEQTAPLPGSYETGVPGEFAVVMEGDYGIAIEIKTAGEVYNLPGIGNADQEFSFSLSGLKWHDRNADGVIDSAATLPEEYLGDWTIIFDADGNGPDLNDILAATTPGTGLYTLGVAVEAGTYYVYEQLKETWYQSFPNPENETDGFGGRYRVEVSATGVVTVFRDDPAGSVTVDNQALNFGNFQPAFTITKTGDLLSKIGDPVDYTITIVNTGDGFLSNALVVDNVLGDLLSEANPYVTSILGDNGTLGVLDYGETWTINATRDVQPGDTDPLPNTVTATFTIPYSVDTLSSSDDHAVNLFQPSIDIQKSGTLLSKIGDPVTYNYSVTNTGSADSPALVNVVIKDDNATPGIAGDDFFPTFVGGDTNGDGQLQQGETWTYTETLNVPAGAPDPYINIATVTSNPLGFTNNITDSDDHVVDLFQPGIAIQKSGTLLSKIGDPVTYNYSVTNTGSADSPALVNVVIKDDNATPGIAGDDFFPTFVGGDTNGDGQLQQGETWTYTETLNVPAGAPDPYINIATVTSNPLGFTNNITDSDDHAVNLFQPSIDIQKSGTLLSKIGDPVTYTYTVTNTGSADSPALVNVVVKDDNATPGIGGDDFFPTFVGGDTNGDSQLQQGETWTYSKTLNVPAGATDPYINIATVTSNPLGFTNNITDSDDHAVNLFQPSIDIQKSGTLLSKIGDPVTYTYTVTNTGSADSPALVNVVVKDDNATPGIGGDDFFPTFVGGDTNGDSQLQQGETWTYSKTLNVPAGATDPYINIATVTSNPLGFTNNITDSDDHAVNLFQPSIDIQKSGTLLSKIGDPVTYTYTVTNTGSADSPALVNVVVKDDNATPGIGGDDFFPTFVGGDTNGDSQLQQGETWTYSKTLNVPAGATDPYINIATVTSNPLGFTNNITDSDDHAVNLFQPSIDIQKSGTLLSKIGDPVTYNYSVTNTGSADSPALVNVVIKDDNATPGIAGDDFFPTFVGGDTNGDGQLQQGETWTYTETLNVPAGAPDPYINIATVTSNPLGFTNNITDSDDHVVDLFQPGIAIQKSGTLLSKIGDPVTYNYSVTNTGSADSPALVNVVIKDDNATPGIAGDDFFPTFVGGDTNGDGQLQQGETWTYTETLNVPAGAPDPYINIATVTSNPLGFTNNITDSDDHAVNLFQPSIDIQKSGTLLSKIGDPVTYTYTVTNTGSADSPALVNVVVKDDNATPGIGGDDFFPTFVGGDTNGDSQLQQGETWTYSKTLNVPAGATDPYINIATVTSNPLGFTNNITDSDDHAVNLFQPSIDIQKSGTLLSKIGDPVTYTYTVTNTGSADSPALVNVVVKDDNATPGIGGDDFFPTFVGGDTNGDSQLQQGETWTYSKTLNVPAGATDPYINIATVTSNPLGFTNNITDSDDHAVNLFQPSIDIQKSGTLLSKIGDPVTYTYTVTNTGSADSPALVNVVVKDDNATPGIGGDDFFPTFVGGDTNGDSQLQQGETWTYSKTLNVPAGATDPYINIATVTSNPLGFTNNITDSDDHAVNLFQPSIDIQKSGTLLSKIGDPVTYTYTVTNTGSADSPALVNVVVKDDNATPGIGGDDFFPTFVGGDTNGDSQLQQGETWTYSKTLNVPAGATDPYINIATVTSNPLGFTNNITDSDDHAVNLFQPSIDIQKSGTLLSKIGDPVTYTYTVTNTGSADSPALVNVVVKDDNATPGIGGDDFFPTFVGGDTNGDSQLQQGETWTYSKTLNVPAGATDPYINIATVTSNPLGFTNNITDSDDHAVNLFQPSIDIQKSGTLLSKIGDPVTYTYTVTNTGSADSPALVNVVVKDDNATPGIGGDDFFPTFVGGDTNGDSQLQQGETWTYSKTLNVPAGATDPYINIATVTSNPLGFTNNITDSDDHAVNLFQPSIDIQKSGTLLSKIGDPVTYNYSVTNTGSADSPALVNVVIKDDNATPGIAGDDFFPTFVGGDTNGDGQLQQGETWTYTETLNVPAGAPDPYINIATVTSNPLGFTNNITDSDDHVVDLFQPSIDIQKSGTLLSKIGDPVTYTYTVTNTGSADSPALVNVVVKDDNATPGIGGDDFFPTFVGGDTNGDSQLQQGETWTYSKTLNVPAGATDPYINIATVTSNPLGFTNNITDSDDHAVNLFQPSIDIQKSGTLLSKIGDPVTYTYTVTNTGSADSPALVNVVVKDDNATPGIGGDDFFPTFVGGDTNGDSQLQQGETWTYSKTLNVPAGATDPYINIATVTSNPLGFTNNITDSDDHAVNLFQPSIDIQKSGTLLSKIGDPVTYTYTVTNTGSADSPALVNVVVKDDNATPGIGGDDFFPTFVGGDTNGDSQLQQGETWTYSKTLNVPAGATDPYINIATVTSNPLGFTNNITDSDDHAVNLFQPSISISKDGCDCAIVGGFADYTFTIENTGSSDSPDLIVFSLVDDVLGDLLDPDNVYVTGSTADAALASGETWTITASRKVEASDDDPLLNTVVVQANPEGFPNLIVDSDSHELDILHPALDVEKLIYDPTKGSFVDADLPTGPILDSGVNPVYRFVVTNTGDVDLKDIVLSDNRYNIDGLDSADAVAGNGAYDIASLAAGGVFTIDYTGATWLAGQQTNTATVTTTFVDCCDNSVDLSDSDDANYFGNTGPGVRTPGFWGQTTGKNQWATFWDGFSGNEPKQAGTMGFPKGDLFYSPYTNSAVPGQVKDPVTGTYGRGVLIGDYDRNGLTSAGENTLFYTTDQALQLLNASQKTQQDTRYVLGRDLVASWLNYLAGNPIDAAMPPAGMDTRDQINEGIDWLQALTPDQNDDRKGDGYLAGMIDNETAASLSPAISAQSNAWKFGIPQASSLPAAYAANTSVAFPINSGSSIHTALDLYNNTGYGADGAFAA